MSVMAQLSKIRQAYCSVIGKSVPKNIIVS